jgi:hypothetical protein
MGILEGLQATFAPNYQQQWEQQQHRQLGPDWKLIHSQRQAQAMLDAQLTTARIGQTVAQTEKTTADAANARLDQVMQMGEIFAVMKGRGHIDQVKDLDAFLDLDANTLESITGAYQQIKGANQEISQAAADMIRTNQEGRAQAGEERKAELHPGAVEKQQLDITTKQQGIEKTARELAAPQQDQNVQRAQKAVDDYRVKFTQQQGVETDPVTGDQIPMRPINEFIGEINKQFGTGFKSEAERDEFARGGSQVQENRARQAQQESESVISTSVKGSGGRMSRDDEDMTPEEGIARETLQKEVKETSDPQSPQFVPPSNSDYWNLERLMALKALKQQQLQGK